MVAAEVNAMHFALRDPYEVLGVSDLRYKGPLQLVFPMEATVTMYKSVHEGLDVTYIDDVSNGVSRVPP